MSNQYSLAPKEGDTNIRQWMNEAGKHTRKKLKSGDVNPGDVAPVLLLSEGDVVARPMVWGFPNHQNDGPIYSARAETADERTTFSKSLRERRCIILATGFYDKLKPGAGEPRYLFNLMSTDELYMAGIFNNYTGDDGKEQAYFAMLTTEANEWVEEFNERMPIVLRKDEFDTWLGSEYETLYNRQNVKLRTHKVGG